MAAMKKAGEFLREQEEKKPGPPQGGVGERSETKPPEGGPGGASPKSATSVHPEPEVVPKASRRRFTAKYKQDILRRADACTQPGEVGALLRREGLYSSHLTTWRRQRERGSLSGLSPKKRGRKPDPDKELRRRLANVEKENRRLAERLEKAELIIEVQKKVSRLLGMEKPEHNGRKKS